MAGKMENIFFSYKRKLIVPGLGKKGSLRSQKINCSQGRKKEFIITHNRNLLSFQYISCSASKSS